MRKLARQMRELAAGRRIGFVSGNFNILHPGHLRILTVARENAEFVLVGLNPDPTHGVTVPLGLRLDGVKSIGVVDHAFALPGTAEDFIAALRPEVVVKGKEFEGQSNPEQKVIEGYGGRLIFGSGEMRFSSLDLLRREYFQANLSTIRKPMDFPRRHAFDMAQLADLVGQFSGLRVVVVGDTIVDTYTTCDPLGMSQEDPTIVVSPIDEQSFVGGAGIVAAHARALGAHVEFFSVVGADAKADFVTNALQDYGVKATLLVDETRPTTHKKRYRANNKTLLRVNDLRQHSIDASLSEKFIQASRAAISKADLLLFSDFNYGCLPQSVVDALAAIGKERGLMMTADSQASSQLSDISRFKDMDVVTPTEREARLALRDFDSGLVVLAEKLQSAAHAKVVVLTLGAEGLLCYAPIGGEYFTEQLPAFNTAPKDVAGAGDSLFTTMAMAFRCGGDILKSAYIGSLAAAVQVSRVGNTPLSRQELLSEINAVEH